ncbi:MAG: hypothetical protein AAGA68_02005 [Pseudomonadota bacterium]
MQSSASVLTVADSEAEYAGSAMTPSLTLEDLAGVNKSLGDVSAAVERTFLGASKRTMQTARDLHHVSQLVEKLVTPAERPMEEQVASLAGDAFAVQPSVEDSSSEWAALQEIARKAEAMCAELESLDRCYQMFPVLRVLTQIHGSSLNEESRDLDWFADAIGSEADRGGQVVGNLLVTVKRQASKLRGSIRQAFEGEQQLRDALAESEVVMARSAEQIGAHERAHERAFRAVHDRQRAISSATSELVSSMQFQDAFRQRVEHVQHALEQLVSLRERQVLPGFEADRMLDGAELSVAQAVLVSIVRDQTESLAQDLAQEHRQLESALSRLVEQVDALGSDLANALGGSERQVAEHTLDSTLRNYAVQVGMLARVFHGRSAITRSLRAALAEMDTDLLDLEQVGEAIFLLAVNAVVLAARLGAEGRAIEQIAQQVRSNSTEAGTAIRLVRKLTDELRALCMNATQDEQTVAARSDAQPSVTDQEVADNPNGEALDEAPAADDPAVAGGADLRSAGALRARSAALMAALEQRGEQSDEVLGFCRNIYAGFAATRTEFSRLDGAVRSLSATSAAWAARAGEHSLDLHLRPDLVRALADYFNAHYTMQSERITQGLALMLGDDAPAADAADDNASPAVEEKEDDLSDILF